MKTRFYLALALLASASSAVAQSAVDAYNITPTQLRGTARFVSMGGAFTSLGGDISSMTQNPAGLGLYRHSDIGLTFDISIRNYGYKTDVNTYSENSTKAYFDNFGYVGAIGLGGAMKFFQWGVSYNRVASFDRISGGYNQPTRTSLSNYIAGYSGGIPSSALLDGNGNDPFFDTSEDWLSIVAYNSYFINNTAGSDDQYAGQFQNGTFADALYKYHESGYQDEYDISFAGNVQDFIYWGLGVGIVDMSYTRQGFYSESSADALVYDTAKDVLTSGTSAFDLYNNRYVSGTGANLKFGLIVRPADMIRIGAAIHTPTWMHLTHSGYANTEYRYSPVNTTADARTLEGTFSTPGYEYRSRLNTPWRFMVGASATIGSKAIVSIDYERVAYNDMTMKEQAYGIDGYLSGGFTDNKYANEDIKTLFQAANIIRVGAELRLSRSVSARVGYNYQTSNVTSIATDTTGDPQVYTSGTDPSYSFDKSTQNFSLGLGYRYKAWYADIAYQWTHRTSTLHAYTPFNGLQTPSADLTDNYHNIVISTGFRF